MKYFALLILAFFSVASMISCKISSKTKAGPRSYKGEEIVTLLVGFKETLNANGDYTLYTKHENEVNQKNPFKSLRFYVLDCDNQTIIYSGNLLDGSIVWDSDHILRIEESIGRVQDNGPNKVVYKYDLGKKRRIYMDSEDK